MTNAITTAIAVLQDGLEHYGMVNQTSAHAAVAGLQATAQRLRPLDYPHMQELMARYQGIYLIRAVERAHGIGEP